MLVRFILMAIGKVIGSVVCGCSSSFRLPLFELFVKFIKIDV